MSIVDEVLNELAAEGYEVNINSQAFTRDCLTYKKPFWDDLFAPSLKQDEITKIDAKIAKILDEVIVGPMTIKLRTIYGQAHIDRQAQEILDKKLSAGLIWFVNVTKIKKPKMARI